jgi:hypothetical protein
VEALTAIDRVKRADVTLLEMLQGLLMRALPMFRLSRRRDLSTRWTESEKRAHTVGTTGVAGNATTTGLTAGCKRWVLGLDLLVTGPR